MQEVKRHWKGRRKVVIGKIMKSGRLFKIKDKSMNISYVTGRGSQERVMWSRVKCTMKRQKKKKIEKVKKECGRSKITGTLK